MKRKHKNDIKEIRKYNSFFNDFRKYASTPVHKGAVSRFEEGWSAIQDETINKRRNKNGR